MTRTRGQKVVALIGLVIVLGALGGVLLPSGECSPPIVSLNDVKISRREGMPIFGIPYEGDYVEDRRCSEWARKKLTSGVVVSALTIVGVLVGTRILQPDPRAPSEASEESPPGSSYTQP